MTEEVYKDPRDTGPRPFRVKRDGQIVRDQFGHVRTFRDRVEACKALRDIRELEEPVE